MIKIQHFGILIADDEHFLRQSLKRELEVYAPDFQVVCEAENGQEALDKLAANQGQIQLVFTDIRMPVLDGLALAARIREQYPQVLTVILTGYADFEYARQALRHHVFDFLLKPVDAGMLEDVIGKARRTFLETYSLPEEAGASHRSTQDTVDYVVRYMQTHYMEEIDFGALSAEMGFTSAYLTKLFNKHVGETPLKYLTALRIREACRLLKETDLSVARVGEATGYQDQFHFSKTFRKIMGMNPTAYRKGAGE